MNRDRERQIENGLLIFAVIFLIQQGFRSGILTWPRVIIGGCLILMFVHFGADFFRWLYDLPAYVPYS